MGDELKKMCIFVAAILFHSINDSMKRPHALARLWAFYRDGFRRMTWGRTLWVLVIIKLFVIFVILRLVFFKPALGGMSETEKQKTVAEKLSN